MATTLLMACGSESASPAKVQAPPREPATSPAEGADSPLRWRLVAEPATLAMADRSRFKLRIEVANRSSAHVNANRDLGEFRLNDAPHLGLNNWFRNGVRDGAWANLPPGATAHDGRAVGEAVFTEPGEYVFSYAQRESVASVTVTVTD